MAGVSEEKILEIVTPCSICPRNAEEQRHFGNFCPYNDARGQGRQIGGGWTGPAQESKREKPGNIRVLAEGFPPQCGQASHRLGTVGLGDVGAARKWG